MIYDCFQFFNELDLLKLRLNVLDSIVDKFIICESTVTFSGEEKPLYYIENQRLFENFKHKIIHVVVNDTPDVNPFERDVFQKKAVARGLVGCLDDDIIIFSDLDEIPNPVKLKEIIEKFDKTKIYHLAQRNFYCYFNFEEISGKLLSYTGEFEGITDKKWLGTKVFSSSMLKIYEIDEMRHPERKSGNIRVDDGGWHFSYMGGGSGKDVYKRIEEKIKSAAHQEFNNQKVFSSIKKNMKRKRDILGRKAYFKKVRLDESFPQYLLEHKEEYGYLILKDNIIDKLERFIHR